jgi:alpha,alpha-trehalase
MLFYLFSRRELEALFARLGHTIEEDMLQTNIDYYMERTSHGSTLSRIVHAWVLCECDPDRAWEIFSESLLSDVGDIQGGTTAEGIHLGAMAGTVDIVERSFAGIQIYEDILYFCPNVPGEIERLELHIRYRGQALAITLEQDLLRVTAGGNPVDPVRIGMNDQIIEMPPFSCHTFSLSDVEGCSLPHSRLS